MREHRSSTRSDDAQWEGRARRKSLRGGKAYVSANDTIGGPNCWCGEAQNHDWPGKADGAPHPRGTAS